jgi:hypothetical protein
MSLQNKCAKCGCEDNFLTTPPPCPTAIGCPFEECAEIQYAQCIMYTGDNILCFDDTVVPTDTNMAAAINNIVDYLCFKTTVANDLLCNTDVVVEADTAITLALANTISYFCAQTTITADLDCGQTTIVAEGTTVVDAIEDIVSYFCDSTIIPANISCGQDVVVTEDSTIISAIEDIISYFCTEISNLPTVTILGDNGIDVTPVVVGNNTEYTISATGVKKFVKQFTGVVFDDQTIVVPGTELTACGLLSQACGVNNIKASDFTFNVMYLFAGSWIGLTNQTGVSITANDITGDISIRLDIAPVDPGVTVRVTIIG